ncbi:SGNH/GDSL hydrolase family protein [Reichenbachiella sp. MALMAid0571]|uniref:SGNH/GDSL hydrolase family protein n=1 Tax=Reichenbachiella sp. MALMAid0571 TaxID=3143939 RepID=UPI0032E03862
MNCDISKIAKSITPLLVIILIISCANQEEVSKDSANTQTMDDPTTDDLATDEIINYLALGDSYTIGQGVNAKLRWPNQLGTALKERNYKVETIDIIAQTGWTTSNLLYALDNTETGDYNLVSLLIGVNNQYQGRSFATFKTEFDLLLDKSIGIAGDTKRVFVVSIPDYGVTSFGGANSSRIGQEIDMYNDYMADQCDYRKIPFINITEVSRALGDSKDALAPDGLHPSGSQYAAWVNDILPVVVEVLNK